jgi:tellurite methyltransferase
MKDKISPIKCRIKRHLVYFCLMETDRIKWNGRHAERKGHHPPDSYLLKMQNKLKSGKLLDIACGRGRNGLFLAKNNFEVLATDISEIGLSVVDQTAARQNLTVKTLQLDLDKPNELLTYGQFDSIIIINFKPLPALLALLPTLLAPGGTLLWCSFNDLQIESFGFAPEKALFPQEFSNYFEKLTLVDYSRFQDDSGHRDGYLWEKKAHIV